MLPTFKASNCWICLATAYTRCEEKSIKFIFSLETPNFTLHLTYKVLRRTENYAKRGPLPISFSTVFNSSALRLCLSWINWLALNLALVCLFKNFLWSLFSKQSQWSSFLVLVAWSKWRSSRFRHAEIFHKPFLFKTHLNFWNIWQGAWNLGFKHSTANISWVVNFLTNGLLELELVILVNWSICVRILAQRSSVILPLSIKNACLQLGAGSTVTSSLKKKNRIDNFNAYLMASKYFMHVAILPNFERLLKKGSISIMVLQRNFSQCYQLLSLPSTKKDPIWN